jgi:hypothetical protein
MSKLRFEDRIDNAVSAFFETAPDRSNFVLTYTGHESVLTADKPFTEKVAKWSGILREILLFGPGTFYLFYTTLAVTFFYPSYGIGAQGLLMFLFGIFLTHAGAGSIYRARNLAVPGTVIAMALGVVLFSTIFAGNDLANMYFWYSIYLFPFVLIAAKLVQRWVADK